MSDPESPFPVQRLRTMQIIVAALIAGVVTFAGISLYLVFVQNQGQGQAPAGELPIITLIALALFVLNAPLAFMLPGIVTRNALRQAATTPQPPNVQDDSITLLNIRQTSLIVGLALLEGAAFLGLVAFINEGQLLALAVAALAVILMLVQFPTEGRVRGWLDLQSQRLRELRGQ